MSRIRAVGIVVPARDEEDAVVACLRSVRRAADAAARRDGVATAVTVVLDRCADRTPERVAALLAGWPRAEVLVVRAVGSHRVADTAGGPLALAGGGVGALRDLGARHVLGRLGGASPEDTWLLHTDADTVVPPGWVRHHLALARAGAGGVAGLADLDADAAGLSAPARERYAAVLARGLGVGTHDHVYGANLGVRADAYLAAGGFPVDGPGEDHGLWRRLADAGVPLERSRAVRVRTSARLRGRAAGGLADLLRSLELGTGDPGLDGPAGPVPHAAVPPMAVPHPDRQAAGRHAPAPKAAAPHAAGQHVTSPLMAGLHAAGH